MHTPPTKTFGYLNLQRLVGDTLLQDRPKLTRRQAADATDHAMAALAAILARGEPVRIPGLGVFAPEMAKARQGRNPATGQAIDIPARGRLKFRPSKAIRKAIAGFQEQGDTRTPLRQES